LPDGAGRELVQSACVACHDTSLITESAGYTYDQWHHLIERMVALPEPTLHRISQYLATHFPQRYDRYPTLVSGETEIRFQEWEVPILGQRPRDPLMTPDGMIWWAGMYASLIGRLDPATGEMTEWKLDPEARPHSIINDAEGNIWYTGNGNGTIGRLDPTTGEITEYPLPDEDARDPHTPIVTRSGDIWFTVQHSDMLGRLVPETGEIRLIDTPTEGAKPYGIDEDSKGMLWVAYRGAAAIARVDPDSWEIREYRTPNPNPEQHHGRHYVRRLAVDSNDVVWYGDSGRGYVGRLDPETAKSRSGRAPAGRPRTLTRSRSSTTSSGTTNRTSGPTRWCDSIQRPNHSRAGRCLPASASSATCE